MILRAKLLESVPHGFATREGGASTGPYASLNLGRSVGDDEATVIENHRRLAAEARFDLERLVTPDRQVHGAAVKTVSAPGATGDCDALITGTKGMTVGIRTADCVPVLLLDRDSGRVAAVHAGWRGVAASIVPAAVKALGKPARIVAAIGPAIGGCCYEVDEDTAEKIATAAPRISRVPTRPGHVRVDLGIAVAGQLEAAGVGKIEMVGGCTACDPKLFFSHRRDRGLTGRHLSFIAPAGIAPAGGVAA